MSEAENEKSVLDSLGIGDDVIKGTRARENAKVAAGQAILRVSNTMLNRSRSGKAQLVAVCDITDHQGDASSIGMSFHKRWGLETAQNFEWLKGDALHLGLGPINSKDDITKFKDDLTEGGGIEFVGSFVANEDEQYPPNLFINAGARKLPEHSGQTGPAGGKF